MDLIKKIAVIGPNANKKHSKGGGSSMIRSLYEITPIQGLKNKSGNKIEFVETPSEADVVLFIGGLDHKIGNDSEAGDKKNMVLPYDQDNLILNIVKENPNTIVILVCGSPIEMNKWLDKVPAVILAWYGGLEGGNALAKRFK